MSPDPSGLRACATLVERGDPQRFAAVMAAPVAARAPLLTLYAFNLEVARVPWMTKEPMIAEMRLQWWRDAVEEAGKIAPQGPEIMAPLVELIAAADLPRDVIDRLIEARNADTLTSPFESDAALESYIEATSAGLYWLCARALGAPDAAETPIRHFGWAAGMAAYLAAVAELEARGRRPLPDGRAEAIKALADQGLERLARARAGRGLVPKSCTPAFLAGWQTAPLLRLAAKEPARVADGRLQLSEFARRGGLLWRAFSTRW